MWMRNTLPNCCSDTATTRASLRNLTGVRRGYNLTFHGNHIFSHDNALWPKNKAPQQSQLNNGSTQALYSSILPSARIYGVASNGTVHRQAWGAPKSGLQLKSRTFCMSRAFPKEITPATLNASVSFKLLHLESFSSAS